MSTFSSRTVTSTKWVLPAILCIIVGAICGQATQAQTIEVPIDVQCGLFGKILQFDAGLRNRAGDTLVIAVVFQKDYRMSEQIKEKCLEGLTKVASKPVQGLPVQIKTIDLGEGKHLDSLMLSTHADLLVVTPIDAAAVDSVIATSRKHKRLTLSTVAGYVEEGLSVGIGLKDNKPELVVNLAASRLEGAELTAKFLRLCRIVGQDNQSYDFGSK